MIMVCYYSDKGQWEAAPIANFAPTAIVEPEKDDKQMEFDIW